MRFEKLLQHVQRAEQRVELRATHAQLQWATLKQTWREGWTPGRIVIAGLVSGFLAGRAEPLRAIVNRCTANQQRQRYRSARTLLRALKLNQWLWIRMMMLQLTVSSLLSNG